MKKLLIIIPVILFTIACNKSKENNTETENGSLSGRYIGIFYRTGGDTANVALMFEANRFSGSSDKTKYPAICNGTFSLDKNGGGFTFHVDNDCVWTADFDWSLILDGDYELNFNTYKSVTIVRHSFASSDFYTLWKVVR